MKIKNDAEVRLKVTTDSKESENGIDRLNNKAKETPNHFNKIGDIGKKVFKATAVAVGTATVALGGLVTKAVQSYAELEQNIGGVETLFKESANTVIENAKKAYKTAGMSANEYMQNVTSFSASLLQSLDGDTKKASEYADRAMIDMSDNANKMGTSMEMITNAYQGFAKQNYTMLDNLKLGYGGTQTEMQRLIKDASEMKDVQEELGITVDANSMSFGNIVNAISVMQKSMGIAGTTAQEAEQTISGSINMLKASFDNFLNGSGKIEDVINSALVVADNLSNAIVKLAPQVIQGLVDLINGLVPKIPGLLEKLLPVLITGAVNLITGLVNSLPKLIPILLNGIIQALSQLTSVLPQILQSLIQGVVFLIQSIAKELPTLIPQIIKAILDMIPLLLQNLPLFMDTGIQLIIGLAEGLINAIPVLVDMLPTIIESLINGLMGAYPQLILLGPKLLIGLSKGLIKAIPSLVSITPQIWKGIVNGLRNGIGSFVSVGADLIKGLWNGISDLKNWVINKVKGLGSSIIKGLKGALGIHSPSKEFAIIGQYSVMGYEEGLDDMQKDLDKRVENLVDLSGLDYLQNGFANVSANYGSIALPNNINNNVNNITVNAEMGVDSFGRAFVKEVKTFSGGAKNDFNYGGSR